MLAGLFKRRDTGNTAAESLYLAAVEAARRPVLFTELGVPDTLDGQIGRAHV